MIAKKVAEQKNKDLKKKLIKKFDIDDVIMDRTPYVDNNIMELIRGFVDPKELKYIENTTERQNDIRVYKERLKDVKILEKIKRQELKNLNDLEKDLKNSRSTTRTRNNISIYKERLKDVKQLKKNKKEEIKKISQLKKEYKNKIVGVIEGINFSVVIQKMVKKDFKFKIREESVIIINNILNDVLNKLIQNNKYQTGNNMREVIIDFLGDMEILKYSVVEGTKAINKLNEVVMRADMDDEQKYNYTKLYFPFSKINEIVQDLSKTVYISAVLEYILAEIIYISKDVAMDNGSNYIRNKFIIIAFDRNEKLNELINKLGYKIHS
jgi:hypothetical protein